jgi:hypothetical protein
LESGGNDFIPNGMLQGNLLDPKTAFYEISVPDKVDPTQHTIEHIQSRGIMAGNFTKQQLAELLDEDQAEKDLYVLHCNNHAINISYRAEDNKWLVHDPNSDHRVAEKMEKVCNSKEAAIDEIIKRMNTFPISLVGKVSKDSLSVSIEVATWDSNRSISFPSYNKLLENPPLSLIDKGGLSRMAYSNWKILPDLLSKPVFQSPAGEKAVARALNTGNSNGNNAICIAVSKDPHMIIAMHDKGVFKSDLVRKAFISAFFMRNSSGYNAVRVLTCTNGDPTIFLELVDKKIFQTKEEIKLLANGLTALRSDGWTTIHDLASRHRNVLISLIDKGVFDSPDSKKILVKTLTSPTKDKWSPVNLIMFTDPGILLKLLDRNIFQSKSEIQSFATSLKIANEEGRNLVHSITNNHPEMLLLFLEKDIFKSDVVKKSLATALVAPDKNGLTPMHAIVTKKPEILLALFASSIFQTNQQRKALVKVLTTPDKTGESLFTSLGSEIRGELVKKAMISRADVTSAKFNLSPFPEPPSPTETSQDRETSDNSARIRK